MSVKIEDRFVESMGCADAVAQSNEFAWRGMEAVLGPPFAPKLALLKPIPSTYRICQAPESQRADRVHALNAAATALVRSTVG